MRMTGMGWKADVAQGLPLGHRKLMKRLAHSGLAVAAIVGGCSDFQPPRPQDPSLVVGCHAAPGAPTFELEASQMRVVGTQIAVPFAYERKRIGMVIRTPLEPVNNQGQMELISGNDHLFPVNFIEGQSTISLVFEDNGSLVTYYRVASALCD